jgi:prephenate dehydrogenase
MPVVLSLQFTGSLMGMTVLSVVSWELILWAGGEQAGFEHARGDLFDGRVCVVTPESASVDQLKRVSAFWELLGCRVFIMSADEHDRILALTSHLPHVLAVTAASCVSSEMLPFTGTGFRDTTRIAEGSPRLWTEILRGNRVHMLQAVRAAQAVLSGVEAALDADDMMALELLLSRAAAARRAVREYHRSDGHIAKQPLDSGLANTES